MTGLATNVLVRLIVLDGDAQSRVASAFVRSACTAQTPCLIDRIVLCELEWVLDGCYAQPRSTIARVIERVLRTAEFSVEQADLVWRALREYRNDRADFADCLLGLANAMRGCDATATFDRQAAELADFMMVPVHGT
ncbi:MAG: PIN domain-containing protein [Pseudomonadota bacterium]